MLTCLLSCPGLARPFGEIPSPRPAGWVSDTVGLLDAPARSRLNQKLEEFHRRQKAEFSVVIVDSADGMPSKQYAHELFNHWHVGRAGYNDGILFVVFQRDHRMEVEVGEGCRALMPDQKTAQILQTAVVPQFKAGHPHEGLTAGVEAICEALTPVSRIEDSGHLLKQGERRQLDQLVAEKERQGIFVLIRLEANQPHPESRARELQRRQVNPFYAVALVGDGKKRILARENGNRINPGGSQRFRLKPKGAWAVALTTALKSLKALPQAPPPPAPPPALAPAPPSESGFDYGWLGFAGLGLGVGLGATWMMVRRHLPRKCPYCKNSMQKMSEYDEDEFLDQGQQAEETHGSVDYDVWVCHQCDFTKIQGYAAWTSSLKQCGRCGYQTSERNNVVLNQATEYREGRGRTDIYCRHCGHRDKEFYSIARITRSESSDSSSSWSNDSSSSSSSSSGFSGGSSDGGGAGASW